jgi:hypothetical protein
MVHCVVATLALKLPLLWAKPAAVKSAVHVRSVDSLFIGIPFL